MIQTLFGSVPQEPTFFEKLQQGIRKTREGLAGKLEDLFAGKKVIDADLLDELEYVLIGADIGVRTTGEILESVKQKLDRKQLKEIDELRTVIRVHLLEVLRRPERVLPQVKQPPAVVLVIGVNGAGKTTSIGKLAARYKLEGHSVLLAAADTFRAAAIEQLEVWGQRTNCDVIRQKQGADPSAVVYDAIQAAIARKVEYIIVDTAGRLHTQGHLMRELEKIHRVVSRQIEGAPHEVLLVLDATNGQNAIAQAEQFKKTVRCTGIVLTKLDGTAKGGAIFAIKQRLDLPVKFIGVGEKLDDLDPFDPETYVDALFA